MMSDASIGDFAHGIGLLIPRQPNGVVKAPDSDLAAQERDIRIAVA